MVIGNGHNNGNDNSNGHSKSNDHKNGNGHSKSDGNDNGSRLQKSCPEAVKWSKTRKLCRNLHVWANKKKKHKTLKHHPEFRFWVQK